VCRGLWSICLRIRGLLRSREVERLDCETISLRKDVRGGFGRFS
jgi:hypothetical protein